MLRFSLVPCFDTFPHLFYFRGQTKETLNKYGRALGRPLLDHTTVGLRVLLYIFFFALCNNAPVTLLHFQDFRSLGFSFLCVILGYIVIKPVYILMFEFCTSWGEAWSHMVSFDYVFVVWKNTGLGSCSLSVGGGDQQGILGRFCVLCFPFPLCFLSTSLTMCCLCRVSLPIEGFCICACAVSDREVISCFFLPRYACT